MSNHLYYGDNLDILRAHIKDESVDLIYLDPPFNSNATYNVLFKAPSGEKSQAQIEAFEDTWHWTEHGEEAFDAVMHSGHTDAAEMLRSMRSFLKENDMMAYLAMMGVRLIELHRVLKDSGSICLHCDLTAKHYLKILLDSIFGPTNFRNEITWVRTTAGKPTTKNLPKNADYILWYAKSDECLFRSPRAPLTDEDRAAFNKDDDDGRGPYNTQPIINPAVRPNLQYTYRDKQGREWPSPPKGWRFSEARMRALEEDGRLSFGKSIREKYYLSEREAEGKQMSNVWTDISGNTIGYSKEGLGYPTQKPLELLERFVEMLSPQGGAVLDPFCGCGTTIHAAQRLNRQWVGIDITHLAISLIEKRLRDAFPGIKFDLHGTPKDIGGAEALFKQDPYQFQWWAVSLIDAVPYGGKKRGADSGIDGFIYFKPDGKTTEKAIVSVKGGANVNVSMIRDMGHVVDREKAKMGVFVTLAKPTGPMEKEAVKAGFYETPYGKFPKLQIVTIEDLFAGKKPKLPLVDTSQFKKAQKEDTSKQGKLF